MDNKPTKIVRRGDPGAEDVAWDYAECWAYRPDTGKPVSYAESLDPNCNFTQIIYITAFTAGRITETVKLYRFYRPEAETPQE
ncbi:MAG TPA: hypothetical protein G4N98_09040 [Thermoflexia bacterium]|nr:hypothetical protein [Thermoflexia bacterium]